MENWLLMQTFYHELTSSTYENVDATVGGSFRHPERVVKDVMVKIRDHYVPTDFMVLDMGEEDNVHLILGQPFLNTTGAIIYIRTGEIYF
jgi:hypothetical protein